MLPRESAFNPSKEGREIRSEAEKFKAAVEKTLQKMSQEGTDRSVESEEARGEIRAKVGSLENMVITKNVVKAVAEILVRFTNFEISFEGETYPQKRN